MMKKIIMSRRSGKTEHIIRRSHITNLPIVCASYAMKNHIKRTATRMQLEILDPVAVPELDTLKGKELPGVLIDDADLVLESLIFQGFGFHVETITMSPEP